MSKNIAVYGSGWQAAQSALTLADLGLDVDLITPASFLDADITASEAGLNYWPLLLRTAVHPRVHLLTNSVITGLSGQSGAFTLRYRRSPRFVKAELCTACGECQKVCSVKIDSGTAFLGSPVVKTAIHQPVADAKSVPSAYLIEKEGISPCRGGCPLEINVHGYISLLRQGKVDKALNLINQKAPLAGVLGRLCTHPCETKCSRQSVDKPLFIQALHRYAADDAAGALVYTRKTTARHSQKIAIIGSGPAGLSASWELARRGYQPVIFESHPAPGGMLAVAIPGFRLPSEVRQKEIAAIQKLGVDIQTGVTFGRDVTLDSLRQAGYRAVFLAIGAHRNNRLNIPGERFMGVVDCISWLRDFNSHPEGRIDQKIVIIGGGNSAVDSARSAKRLSKGEVRVLCLTAEMTAVPEEVEETLKEGIPIDYNHSALEILGHNGHVTGIRCIKVRNVQFDSQGRISLEQIAGSEYVVPADKVIIAIGQRPGSDALNINGLAIAPNSTLTVDPLTLETGLPGLFAGGDAVTGSKNVVSAMSAGLRAAESIDRYLRGESLSIGRTLEPLKTVEIDVSRKKASKQPRVKMPALAPAKRQIGFTETSLGLSADLAEKESSRCLDCAGCSECLECENVCEVKAVNHSESLVEAELSVAGLISLIDSDFLSSHGNQNKLSESAPGDTSPVLPGEAGCGSRLSGPASGEAVKNTREFTAGVYHLAGVPSGDSSADSDRASALALKAALDLNLVPCERQHQSALIPFKPSPVGRSRVSVFLCSCGLSNSAILDFSVLTAGLVMLPDVVRVHPIEQSCTPAGAAQIRAAVLQDGASQAVLAACRCCDWDQVCFSCGDRRVMCRENLNLALPSDKPVEYVNIREMCAWLYRDDPPGATQNALRLITAGVKRAARTQPVASAGIAVTNRALIISGSLGGLSAAVKMAAQGYGVTLLSTLDDRNLKSRSLAYQSAAADLLKELINLGVEMLPWPQSLILNGAPGRYAANIQTAGQEKVIFAGAVILDIDEAPLSNLQWLSESHLLARVIKRWYSDYRDPARENSRLYPYSIGQTAAILFMGPFSPDHWQRQISAGEAAAASASIVLTQESARPRGSAVTINRPLCRGCGDCAAVCALIELKSLSPGLCYAEVDPALCLGCGACVGTCPTGAIKQAAQSEAAIETSLEAIFGGGNTQ
jgi:NADPH-dependent glutamate synthase beta subunit-like oxidoreductase/NAD-dependent dihydropyrimidine dehydrogenase PreA subunit